jgi:hypothetical protein
MCTTHPNVDGKTWVIRGDTKYGKSDGQKYIQISINGERIPNGQARYSQCKGYATFGSEPRARSRDCLNHIMKNKEINKGIYDLMGNRFKSKGRVTMEPGFDRVGGQYATFPKTNVKECQAKCIADKVCKVFTHARETCYLKVGSSGTLPAALSTTAGRKW